MANIIMQYLRAKNREEWMREFLDRRARRRSRIPAQLHPEIPKEFGKISLGLMRLPDRDPLKLLLDATSLVDRWILRFGGWEREQMNLMSVATRQFASGKNGAYLDIGACWGLYAMQAVRDGVGEVHLFEPDRRNFAQLQAQLFLNEMSYDIHAHHTAVSDEDGFASFRRSETIEDGNRGGTGIIGLDYEGAVTIPKIRIDTLLTWTGRNVVIKLDVERHEPAVLRGMREFVANNRIFMQAEMFEPQRDATMAAAHAVGLRHVHAISADQYFTNVPAEELGWLNQAIAAA